MLLDENLPKRLLRLFEPDVDATTVVMRGWAGKKNGELLAMAETEFDALVTMDRNMPFQQNLARFDLAAVIFEARSNSYADLLPLMNEANSVLQEARPGAVLNVGGTVDRPKRRAMNETGRGLLEVVPGERRGKRESTNRKTYRLK